MALAPVYADEALDLPRPTTDLVLSPSQQQLIGVHLTTVTQEPMEVPLRALGRVTPDDTIGVACVMPVLPQFDASARTLRVRLEASNPNLEPRPDQFVDLILKIRLPPVVTVPSDAILDSGLKKTVYVGGADGHFEARTIQTDGKSVSGVR